MTLQFELLSDDYIRAFPYKDRM